MISNLLSGKRKIDVQNQLFKLGFVEEILNPLFDIFFDEKTLTNSDFQRFDDVNTKLINFLSIIKFPG